MIDIAELPSLWGLWQGQYTDRDERFDLIASVVRGDLTGLDGADDDIISRSPNFIQVAAEDTAEAASLMPTIRVTPQKATAGAKATASKMERIGAGYFDSSKMDLLLPATLLDLAVYGMGVWVIWPDDEQRVPIIEKRDPRMCYPEPGYRPGDEVNRAIFARQIPFASLPLEYRAKCMNWCDENDMEYPTSDHTVTLIEFVDKDGWLIAAVWQGQAGQWSTRPAVQCAVELEFIENKSGRCPVVVGSRFTLDGEFRGQYDQVINVMLAHVRLMGLVLDYADQSVYSDIWVKDIIGEMPFGGGGYIELGPNGNIGRVPPAVSSLNVQADLANLVESFHLGAKWPKTRPGQVDQAIASAKFVEATAGMLNTAIKSYHTIISHMMEAALRLCFVTDAKYFPGKKTTYGVLRNQEFIEEYSSDDIDLGMKPRVEYGLGFGRDPAQTAVLSLQYAAKEYISEETVQENIDGLRDIGRERQRIDVQKLSKMAFAKLLMGLEQGTVPEEALLDIAEARVKGDDIFTLYRKFIVEPQKKQQESAIGSGLMPPGPQGQPGQMQPGPIPGPPGAAGIKPPPPPNVQNVLAQLSTPAGGPGSFLGAQVK